MYSEADGGTFATILCFLSSKVRVCVPPKHCLFLNSTVLEECKFAPDRIQVFTTIYTVSHSCTYTHTLVRMHHHPQPYLYTFV